MSRPGRASVASGTVGVFEKNIVLHSRTQGPTVTEGTANGYGLRVIGRCDRHCSAPSFADSTHASSSTGCRRATPWCSTVDHGPGGLVIVRAAATLPVERRTCTRNVL